MLNQSPSPVGKDISIQRLQSKLHTSLLTKWGLNSTEYLSYDRCYPNKKDKGYVAEVYTGANQYKEVYWDDAYSVVSFFGVSERENFNMVLEVPVHIVFFVDLSKIKPTRTNRADEEARKDVLDIIGGGLFGFSFQSVEVRIENVLKEYKSTLVDKRLVKVDMHPIHAFRINLLLKYDMSNC
jgi:hypothetical protein